MAQVAGTAAAAIIGTIMNVGATVASNKVNAQASEEEARNFEQNAQLQERQFRRSADLEAGKGRAIAAASGVRADTGSPLLLELDFAKQAELEAQNIRRTGRMQASAKRFEARLTNRSTVFALANGGMQGASFLSSFFANPETSSRTSSRTSSGPPQSFYRKNGSD